MRLPDADALRQTGEEALRFLDENHPEGRNGLLNYAETFIAHLDLSPTECTAFAAGWSMAIAAQTVMGIPVDHLTMLGIALHRLADGR